MSALSSAATAIRDQLGDMLSGWLGALLDQRTRVYRLEGDGALAKLAVEAFSLREHLSEPFDLRLSTLTGDATLDVASMLGQRVTLVARLADGSDARRSAIVLAAENAGADGSLSRYRLTLGPWLTLLGMSRGSRVWQEKTVAEIIDDVFAGHAAQAAWRWSDDVGPFLAASRNAGVRSYTVQYRESDLAFVQRLLAEEGLGWRVEEADDAPLGHRVVIFADSVSDTACPEDATSAAHGGIRFHRASSQEQTDAIQAFGGVRRLQAALSTALGWDYKRKAVVAASVPTDHDYGGANAPRLESYDHAGSYAFADAADAERATRLAREAIEARNKHYLGRGTVRTLRSGSRFTLTQSTLDILEALGQDAGTREFLVLGVTHAGINNLPKDASEEIARRLGTSGIDLLEAWVDDDVRRQTAARGYANAFTVQRRKVPWRPLLEDDTGARLNPKPTALGLQSATVVGPEGQTSASGAEEIHMDALGRIRIKFHWQQGGGATSQTSTWVRVMQRYAAGGMGAQFIPRIGQEVLVAFSEGDIDRPIVIGALYNGRGEAGISPTPGGQAADNDTSAFKQSSDHRPSAQANLSGGNAPAWHGASAADFTADGQRNASALSGYKTQEFGGAGYNQLVFDDSNQQLRTQLATTQHASQLNLGHLIHQADNHRGSFRGLGFELRTDAYGAIRAANGLLISSYGTVQAEPAGDNAAGMALAGQLKTLAASFSKTAKTHQTVQLAGDIGSSKASQSSVDDKQAPLAALHTVLKGMVAEASDEEALADANAKKTQAGKDKLPHQTDPIVAIAAKAGLGLVAGQDLQMNAGEGITLASGQDTQFAVGGASRLHTGQAIGILAGAIKPGGQAAGKGLTLIAGKGDLELQAQAGTLQMAAKQNVSVQSAKAHIDWASPKKISLSTAGGANITIEGGNITVQCPGKITVFAGKKSFIGPANQGYVLPVMPSNEAAWVNLSAHYEDAWNTPWPLDGLRVDVNGGTVAETLTVDMKQELN